MMGLHFLRRKKENTSDDMQAGNGVKTFLSSFAIGITNPASLLTFLSNPDNGQPAAKPAEDLPSLSMPPAVSEENTVSKMYVQVGDSAFTATLADNCTKSELSSKNINKPKG